MPSLLSLRSPWLWLAIGFLYTPDGLKWWLAVLVVDASWAVPAMRHAGTSDDEPLHRLAPKDEPRPQPVGERPA